MEFSPRHLALCAGFRVFRRLGIESSGFFTAIVSSGRGSKLRVPSYILRNLSLRTDNYSL